jgi:uncharacterized BrkB/YihY/UPF0761 family membrane protein
MSTELFQRILWAAAAFNVLIACMVGFPASPAGQLAGLPAEVPLEYRAILATFVLLFAGVYAWLATQPEPNRPMVVLGALGKASVVVVGTAVWLATQAPVSSLGAVAADLVFVLAFAWWLKGSNAAADKAPGVRAT